MKACWLVSVLTLSLVADAAFAQTSGPEPARATNGRLGAVEHTHSGIVVDSSGAGTGSSDIEDSSSHFGVRGLDQFLIMVREGAPSRSLLVRDAKRRGWRAFAHHVDWRHHRRFAKMRTAQAASIAIPILYGPL